jgi:hypothetical protein
MAPGQINDGKAPKPESNGTGKEVTLIVGSTMRDGTRHPYNRLVLDRFAAREVKLTCDAAHVQRSEIRGQKSGVRPKTSSGLILNPADTVFPKRLRKKDANKISERLDRL